MAAQTHDSAGVAQSAGHAPSDVDQELIAGGVPERIVDLFEPVQIHQQQRKPAIAAIGLDRCLDSLAKQRPAREPGQRVVQRLMAVELSLLAQLLLCQLAGVLGQLALADIQDHAIQPRRRTVLVKHHATVLSDPTDLTVGMDQPIRQRVRAGRLHRQVDINDHLRTITGVNQRPVPPRRRLIAITTTPIYDTGNVGHHRPELLMARAKLRVDGRPQRLPRRQRTRQSERRGCRGPRAAGRGRGLKTWPHEIPCSTYRPAAAKAKPSAGRCADLSPGKVWAYRRHIAAGIPRKAAPNLIKPQPYR